MGIPNSTILRALCGASAALVALQGAEAPRWQWKLREFTWVKRQAAEKGAPPNTHPASISAESLARELGAVQFKSGAGLGPLFTKEELAPLVGPLQEALSVAGPGDDLCLLSTDRRGGSFLNTSFGVTARLFVADGALNVIVHDARLDFMDRFRATGYLAEFNYGSRQAPGTVDLKAGEGMLRRSDWLRIPLDRLQAAPPTPKAAPAPAAERLVLPAEPVPVPKARDAKFFEEQEQRLRALKRLRDESLISEEEYQRKRKEILEAM